MTATHNAWQAVEPAQHRTGCPVSSHKPQIVVPQAPAATPGPLRPQATPKRRGCPQASLIRETRQLPAASLLTPARGSDSAATGRKSSSQCRARSRKPARAAAAPSGTNLRPVSRARRSRSQVRGASSANKPMSKSKLTLARPSRGSPDRKARPVWLPRRDLRLAPSAPCPTGFCW